MAGLRYGAWSETCLVTITRYVAGGGTDVEFAALTETIDIDLGDKDIDQVVSVKGGRLVKKLPQDITTVTFEGYPVDVDSSGGTGVSQMFGGETTWDATEPKEVSQTISRDLFRVVLLWTDETSETSACGEIATGYNAYRIIFAHARMTSMKPSFTDGILKFTFSFKCPAFNPKGIALIHEQSSDSTDTLTALHTYNSNYYTPLEATAYTW